jgi:two-component system LytT family response regulator
MTAADTATESFVVDEPIRVLVVDDEPLARDDLVRLLIGRRGVSIVGTCSSGLQTVDAVARLRPDLLFLDIRMPGLDGFEVVARIAPARRPHVVFVTAYDRYAIDAFHVRALDYLLKPVRLARLDDALSRARERLRSRAAVEREVALRDAARDRSADGIDPGYWNEVVVRAGLRNIIVRVDEIDWIEADAYYARIYVRGRSYLLRERMHVLETRLDPAHFARVHRSAIVNVNRVGEIAHDGQGEHVIVLKTGARVKTSHARWLEFRELMRRRGYARTTEQL